VKNQTEFRKQIETHAAEIESLFGKKPEVFSNTDQIYSDQIGALVAEMGYKAILAEGSSHVMKWRSPNYLYSNAINNELAVMLKNDMLSDDIAFRFSNKHWIGWPLTAQKYVSWLNKIPKHEKIVNLFIDYETFGERQNAETGIFNFLETLPLNVCRKSDFQFQTFSEALNHHECISTLNMPEPTSCADHERDLSAWLGNELQKDAFENLYELSEQILHCTDRNLLKDWQYLQTSDHFYYMSTKHHSDGSIHAHLNPYNSPYEAFLNYSNILNDFTLRLNRKVKAKTQDMAMVNKDESLPNSQKSSARKTHKTSSSNIF
jgi:alpha-amylase